MTEQEETAKREARNRRREAGKDVYCTLCGKEIGDWINCWCHASKWRGRVMMKGNLDDRP
jgi:hypothetical protein